MPTLYPRRILAPDDRPVTVGAADPGPYTPPRQARPQPPAPYRGPDVPGDRYDAGPPEPPSPRSLPVDDPLASLLQDAPPAPREPTIRARTTPEAINDAVQGAYQWVADTLPGRVESGIPFIPHLSDAARSFDEPTPALRYGVVDPPFSFGKGAQVVEGAADLAQAGRAAKVGEGVSEGVLARDAAPGTALVAPQQAAQPAYPLVPPTAPPMSRALDALGSKSEVVKVAKGLFPRLDAYSKPAGLLSSKTILKRLETMPDMAPEVKAALTDLATKIGDRRIQPDELHALAAGEDYTPDRVIRRVRPIAEGEKQIVGAPLGVSNARQARGLRERYLGGIEQGMAGRDWYHDTGESILFHANDDPARARLVAGDVAITSPATSVSANTGMGVKGYNQANANVELPPDVDPVKVETGRFPTAMGKRIEELHAGGAETLGLKRDPFAENMAIGGGFNEVLPLSRGVDLITLPKKTRAVHDIWDAELHGYMNPDGTPMRTGFGPAQHRFMDRQQDKIVATANQRALGGHIDWNDLRTQAAGWTGAKINAGDISPQDAALSPADYFKQHYAQGSRETLPGPTTGHMPQLLGRGMEPFRQHLHNVMMNEAGTYDRQGRDQIAPGFGGLVGRAFEGPGLYKGEISPGMQTRVLTGSEDVPGGPTGARQVDEGSRRLMNATEATYALGMGQDVGAWSRNLPAGSGAPRGLWDVALPGGTITNDQLKWLALRIPNIGDMAVISTDDGVRLGNMDRATMKTIVKMLGGTVKQAGAGLDTGLASGYMQNDYRVDRAGQQFLDPIRLMGTNRFDDFAPAWFDRIRRADAMFRRDTGGRFSLSQMRDELLGTVAGEGFKGLERLAKKYAIPVTLLVAGLQALGHPVPEQPSPEG